MENNNFFSFDSPLNYGNQTRQNASNILNRKNSFDPFSANANNAQNNQNKSLFGDLFNFNNMDGVFKGLGAFGSIAQGIGGIMQARANRKYQKKMFDLAQRDYDRKVENERKATEAVNLAFKDVFGK